MSTADDELSGSELRRRRTALGLTQAALADLLGITPTSVGRWERGEQRPSRSGQLRAVLDGLHTPLRVLRDVRNRPTVEPLVRRSTGDLPRELTTFIGREREIAQVARDLPKTRLLTLTGPGGVGKTRLALEVADSCRSDYTDGACFVYLAPIVNDASVPHTVLAALGLRPEPDRAELSTLIGRLGTCELLLLLDNCEHVLSGCGFFADALLRACPRVRILATSREPLGVSGETVWAVPALSAPDARQLPSVDELLEYEAPRLFVDRASSANASFTLRPHNTPTVAEICRNLDGMPLAIELAAGLVRSLTIAQIAARLGDRFRLLGRGPHAAPARQQTLRATVDWSYDLLSSAERALFNRLSVFVGGWTLEAAETVCADEVVPSAEIVHLLGRLVDRSLVVAEDQSGVMRYRLLETLRQYGAEQVAHVGENAHLRDRHRQWCATLAEQGERDIWRADQLACVRYLALEHDNVRAALAWTVASPDDPEPGLRIAAAMVRFWDVHGHLREGTRWLTDLLALPAVRTATPGWARALTARGYLAVLRGDRTAAIADLDQSLDFWHHLGDSRGLAVALFFRALAMAWTGAELSESVPIFTQSLALAQQRGPRWTAYFCLYCLGEIARSQGDLDTAEALLNQSLSLSSAANERWGAFHALYSLAFLALMRAEWQRANDLAQQSLTLTLELGDTRGSTYALEALGCVAAARGDARRAAHLFGASEALREPVGDFLSATLRADREQGLATVRGTLGGAGFAAAIAAGRRLSLDQAVATARVSELAGGHVAALTARERSIAALVASGLTNRQIADALVVTERTTESHLSHIFTKLGLRSRTQLATWAIESGILVDA